MSGWSRGHACRLVFSVGILPAKNVKRQGRIAEEGGVANKRRAYRLQTSKRKQRERCQGMLSYWLAARRAGVRIHRAPLKWQVNIWVEGAREEGSLIACRNTSQSTNLTMSLGHGYVSKGRGGEGSGQRVATKLGFPESTICSIRWCVQYILVSVECYVPISVTIPDFLE